MSFHSATNQQEIDTFTKWVNLHLKKRDMEVENIFTDFQDGVRLINLYEQISGYEFPKYNKNPKMKVQGLENLRQVLLKIQEFIDAQGLKIQYGSEQLYAGDELQILGLLWVLISKYVIAAGADEEDEETKSLKADLLAWVQECTQDFAPFNEKPVENFTSHFQNGLAFCAIIEHFLPEKIEYDSLNPEENLVNLQTASEAAKSVGIDSIIDEEDIATSEKVNEKSIMAQVGIYRKQLKPLSDKLKAQKFAKQANTFDRNARELSKSIEQKIDEFNNTNFDESSYNQCQEAQDKLFEFRKENRDKLAAENVALEVDEIKMKADRKKGNMEPHEPAVSLEDINDLFNKLSEAEKSYQSRLQQRIDNIMTEQVQGFDEEATQFISSTTQNAELESEEAAEKKDDVEQAYNVLIEKHNALEEDGVSKFVSVSIQRVHLVKSLFDFAVTGDQDDKLNNAFQTAESIRSEYPEPEPVQASEQTGEDQESSKEAPAEEEAAEE